MKATLVFKESILHFCQRIVFTKKNIFSVDNRSILCLIPIHTPVQCAMHIFVSLFTDLSYAFVHFWIKQLFLYILIFCKVLVVLWYLGYTRWTDCPIKIPNSFWSYTSSPIWVWNIIGSFAIGHSSMIIMIVHVYLIL